MTYIERMLNAAQRLSEPGRSLFNALYQEGLTDQQAQHRLGLDPQTFAARHAEMLRSLRAASI